MRIVVMVRESDFDGTALGFTRAAKTMKNLFARAGGSEAVSTVLWVNPHQPRSSRIYDQSTTVAELKKVEKAQPELRDFLRMLIQQSKHRMIVQVLEYDVIEASGAERDDIVWARDKLRAERGEPSDGWSSGIRTLATRTSPARVQILSRAL